jgi:hypothetical protein
MMVSLHVPSKSLAPAATTIRPQKLPTQVWAPAAVQVTATRPTINPNRFMKRSLPYAPLLWPDCYRSLDATVTMPGGSVEASAQRGAGYVERIFKVDGQYRICGNLWRQNRPESSPSPLRFPAEVINYAVCLISGS